MAHGLREVNHGVVDDLSGAAGCPDLPCAAVPAFWIGTDHVHYEFPNGWPNRMVRGAHHEAVQDLVVHVAKQMPVLETPSKRAAGEEGPGHDEAQFPNRCLPGH